MSAITWGTIFPCGQYGPPPRGEGLTLLLVKINHPDYLKWCYEKEMHLKYPEIKFIFDNINSKEFKEILK